MTEHPLPKHCISRTVVLFIVLLFINEWIISEWCGTDLLTCLSGISGGNLIGCGGFGMVYLGVLHNNFKVAIKCLKNVEDFKDTELLLKQFKTEVQMLVNFRHENIVHLLGFSTDGKLPCLVSDLIEFIKIFIKKFD